MQALSRMMVLAVAVTLPFGVSAGVCEYRLSDLLRFEKVEKAPYGGKIVGAAEVGAIGAGAAGLTFKGLGFYTIVHATSGATMIGSTATGASAAGIVGIIGGTSGVIGSIGAFISAPINIAVGVGTTVATTGLEAGCYFFDDRITDPDQVLAILREIDDRDDTDSFKVGYRAVETFWDGWVAKPVLFLKNSKTGSLDEFMVEDLYIVNGILMNRDWFLNSEIGVINVE